jgi:hypothetical protein
VFAESGQMLAVDHCAVRKSRKPAAQIPRRVVEPFQIGKPQQRVDPPCDECYGL